MKRLLFLTIGVFLMLFMSCSTSIKKKDEAIPKTDQDKKMEWWREAKFGMFIHWGLYAVPAGKYGETVTYGEWMMHKAKVPLKEYEQYAQKFNPSKYDPAAWVKMAKDAGMRYIVITSKHHDGFALYPSDVTDWDVADASPYGKDLLGPLVDEAKKADLKIGFYYSQAQDWYHSGGGKNGYNEGDGWDEAHKGDYDAYLNNIALSQVKEILSRYPLDILWWDTPIWMNETRALPFEEEIKRRPNLITNNRLGAGEGSGDMETPEQFIPVTGYSGDWETCMTMNSHWGYNAWDTDWKSSAELIHKLIEICSKGGNFLLNVGPTAEGEFPLNSIESLKAIGEWVKVNGDAIYGTTKGPFNYLSWGNASRKGDVLCLYVTDWPKDNKLHVPLKSKVESAVFLTQPDKKLNISIEEERISIDLPSQVPDTVATVILLKLAEEPVTVPIASEGKKITASSEHPDYPVSNAVDGTSQNIWQSADSIGESYLEFDLEIPTWIQAIGVDEMIQWPKRKQNIRLEVETEKGWEEVFSAKTTGRGYVRKFAPIQTRHVRLYIDNEEEPANIAEWQVYAIE
jgi:alpha-L-fucosidase